MVTLFTTPKPFLGHSEVIQRNALKSWTLLRPDVEVILFGDEEGAAKTAREFGISHIPPVERCSKLGFLEHTYGLRKRLGLQRDTIQHMRGWMSGWFMGKP